MSSRLIDGDLFRFGPFAGVSREAKLLYLYFRVGPQSHVSGLSMIDSREAVVHCGMDRETYADAARELIQAGLIAVDGAWCLVLHAAGSVRTVNRMILVAVSRQVATAPEKLAKIFISRYSLKFQMTFECHKEKKKEKKKKEGDTGEVDQNQAGQPESPETRQDGPGATIGSGGGDFLDQALFGLPVPIRTAWEIYPRRPRGSPVMYAAAVQESGIQPDLILAGIRGLIQAVKDPKYLPYIEKAVAMRILHVEPDRPDKTAEVRKAMESAGYVLDGGKWIPKQ